MAELRLPDGNIVRGCSLAERRPDDPERSFGLYLDPRWEPDWPAELIDWPDFGLPADPERAKAQITDAYRRIRAGELVEVGCLGGRGRTGTVLACLAVLCGLPARAAVEYVRNHYHPSAVETAAQERWVAWFAGESEVERDEGSA